MDGVIRRVAAALALSLAAVASQAAGPYYRIEKLQDPDGLYDFRLAAINNEGMAVGTRYSIGGNSTEGFVYRNGAMQFLGTLGGPNGSAWGLNERGDVLGSADISGSESRTVIYRAGRIIEVPPPPTTESGSYGVVAINNLGHVVGSGMDAVVHHASPYIYDGTRSYFLSIPDELHVETPSAINDRDEVVGTTVHHHAFYHHDGTTVLLPQLPDQPPAAGAFMYGMDINNKGQTLVNYYYDVLASYIYQDGQYTHLPQERFFGVDINEQGWVLGWAGLHAQRPKLYMNGVSYDLNSRILRGEDKGWRMLEVYSMNDLGQIVGRGTGGAFIATPVPEPRTWALMLAGLGFLAAVPCWRRRRPTAARWAPTRRALRSGRSATARFISAPRRAA